MDFSDMGSLDAQNEVKKSGIDTSKGELKSATIRGTQPFLDLLTHVAEKMGMSSEFMKTVLMAIHEESIRQQMLIMK